MRLLAAGVKLRVHDPEAVGNVKAIYGDRLVYCDRPYGALEGADGLVIVTEWAQFRNPDFELMRRLLAEPVIFDGRNLYEGHILVDARGSLYHLDRPADGKPGAIGRERLTCRPRPCRAPTGPLAAPALATQGPTASSPR